MVKKRRTGKPSGDGGGRSRTGSHLHHRRRHRPHLPLIMPADASDIQAAAPKVIRYVGTMDPYANAHLANYTPPSDRPVRIYSDGIYDMFHYGHARSLEQVKRLFPNVYLLVGVCNDELTNSKKGRTVMNEQERAESLRHCRWVDEVVENAPWVIDDAFLAVHKIDFVAHDDIPYESDDSDDVYKFVKQRGQFIATQRTASISTSDLITRIVRDYDQYVRRNIKRGASPRDLNLSLLKQGELKVEQIRGKLQERLKEEEANVKNNWESSRDELKAMLAQWEARSQEFIREFSGLFDVRKIFSRLGKKRKLPMPMPLSLPPSPIEPSTSGPSLLSSPPMPLSSGEESSGGEGKVSVEGVEGVEGVRVPPERPSLRKKLIDAALNLARRNNRYRSSGSNAIDIGGINNGSNNSSNKK